MFPRTWTAAAAPWGALALAVLGLLGVWAFVDLSPEVESDFFFAEDDPQLQASQQISEQYGSVRIRTKSSTVRAASSTRIGNRPCNSGIKSEGLDR